MSLFLEKEYFIHSMSLFLEKEYFIHYMSLFLEKEYFIHSMSLFCKKIGTMVTLTLTTSFSFMNEIVIEIHVLTRQNL